jgi:hypothetical protein
MRQDRPNAAHVWLPCLRFLLLVLLQRREDGTWRWEERDYGSTVYEQVHHPLCKSSSRKLSALGPVEVRPAFEPENAVPEDMPCSSIASYCVLANVEKFAG